MSDLSQLLTNQNNAVYLYTQGTRSGSVFAPVRLIVNANTSPLNSQPLVFGCVGNADPNAVGGYSYQMYCYQKAWVSMSNPTLNQTVGTGFQYISLVGTTYLGQNVSPVVANTVTLPVGGYYKITFSAIKNSLAGTIETVATVGVRLNNLTNVRVLDVQNTTPTTLLYCISFTTVLNLGAGTIIGIYYDTNVSAGSIQISDYCIVAELISAS